ncbi:MAG TPA: ABC transporter permease [Clostridiaceae bacterium]|nr:ABC transporter permease [Clostridiaceae bacterium]
MTGFAALLKNDIKLFFKDWKAVMLLILMPFAFIAFFAYALTPFLNKSSFIEPFDIALVDKEDTAQTRILARQLEEIGIFREIFRVDESRAKEMISDNLVASAIIIPEDFSASVAVGENKPVTVIGNKAMPLQSFVVKNLIQSAANIVSAGQSAINTIYYYNQKAGMSAEELQKQFEESTMKIVLEAIARNEVFSYIESTPVYNLTPVEYFTAALITVFLMFAGMPGMKMLVMERSYGVTKRIEASPVKLWQVVMSKFIVTVILSVVQFLVIIVLTSIVFKNYWGAPVKNILILFAGIIFAVSSWSIFVSAISKTPASADIIGNLSVLLMAMVGGSIYPLSSMPRFIREASKFTINRWAMEGFMVIFSGDRSLSVANYFYVLIAIGLVLLILSTVILRLRRR